MTNPHLRLYAPDNSLSLDEEPVRDCLFSLPSYQEIRERLWYVIKSDRQFTLLDGEAEMELSPFLLRFATSLRTSGYRVVRMQMEDDSPGELLARIVAELGAGPVRFPAADESWRAIDDELRGRKIIGIETVFLLECQSSKSIGFHIVEELLARTVGLGCTVILTILSAETILPAHLKSRSALRTNLNSLTVSDSTAWIAGIVDLLDYNRNPFSPESCSWLHERAEGSPRKLLELCTTILENAQAQGRVQRLSEQKTNGMLLESLERRAA